MQHFSDVSMHGNHAWSLEVAGPSLSFWLKRSGAENTPWEPLCYICLNLRCHSSKNSCFCLFAVESNFLKEWPMWWSTLHSVAWPGHGAQFVCMVALSVKHHLFSKWCSCTWSISRRASRIQCRKLSQGLWRCFGLENHWWDAQPPLHTKQPLRSRVPDAFPKLHEINMQ